MGSTSWAWTAFSSGAPVFFSGIHVTRSFVLCVIFCRSLFVLFFWPLVFDLQILITPLVSSNSSLYDKIEIIDLSFCIILCHCLSYRNSFIILNLVKLYHIPFHNLLICTLKFYYPLANEVAMEYSNATVCSSVRPSFRSILVKTLESTSFNGFGPNLVHT